jgi:hypothetical protein
VQHGVGKLSFVEDKFDKGVKVLLFDGANVKWIVATRKIT